jgi:hypothetical protein
MNLWIGLTLPLAALLAVASVAGLTTDVYARETLSWATQGMGQDIVTLAVVVPVLLVSGHVAVRGSIAAFLVWLGALIYVLYSYILYAFFVHFGAMFPVYVAILGLSFHAIAGSVATRDLDGLTRAAARARTGAASLFLVIAGALFAALWIADIAGSLLAGRVPASVVEAGLTVNPVHVLDLSVICPAMVITGVLLRRRHALGALWAVPLLVFAVLMGIAILAMMAAMHQRGLPAGPGPAMLMGALVLIGSVLAGRLLADLRAAGGPS